MSDRRKFRQYRLRGSAPPPVPQSDRLLRAWAGPRVQFNPLNELSPGVKRVRLTPPFTFAIVACAMPAPALFAADAHSVRAGSNRRRQNPGDLRSRCVHHPGIDSG
jgi:hypothetical protein